MNAAEMPDHIKRLMSPADRKALGAAGRTFEEVQAIADTRAEEALQGDIAQYLNLKGIQYIRPSMKRRSALPPGWPDFTFAWCGVPVCLEAKNATGTVEPDQAALHPKLRANGWVVHVVRSLQAVKALLDAIEREETK